MRFCPAKACIFAARMRMENHFSLSKSIIYVGLVACSFGCAKVGTLQGGPKDDTPPRVDTTHSTRNFTTHFTARRIELTFDEWVQLSDVGTQVIVSPPLASRP